MNGGTSDCKVQEDHVSLRKSKYFHLKENKFKVSFSLFFFPLLFAHFSFPFFVCVSCLYFFLFFLPKLNIYSLLQLSNVSSEMSLSCLPRCPLLSHPLFLTNNLDWESCHSLQSTHSDPDVVTCYGPLKCPTQGPWSGYCHSIKCHHLISCFRVLLKPSWRDHCFHSFDWLHPAVGYLFQSNKETWGRHMLVIWW